MDKLNLDHLLKQCHGDAACEEQYRILYRAAIGEDEQDELGQGLASVFIAIKGMNHRIQTLEQILGLQFVDGEYQAAEDLSATLLGQVAEALERHRRNLEDV